MFMKVQPLYFDTSAKSDCTGVRFEIQAHWWPLYVLKLCRHSNPNGILGLCWHFLISLYTLGCRPAARFILILYFFTVAM